MNSGLKQQSINFAKNAEFTLFTKHADSLDITV